MARRVSASVVLNALVKISDKDLDVVDAFNVLYRLDIVSAEEKDTLISKYVNERNESTERRKITFLAREIGEKLTLMDLIVFLKAIHCGDVANILDAEANRTYERAEQCHSVSISYGIWKSELDDNVYKDRKLRLKTCCKAKLDKLTTVTTNQTASFEIQLKLLNEVVITALRIQLHRDDGISERQKLLDEMKASAPRHQDTSFTDVVYNGKTAIAQALQKNWAQVTHNLTEAERALTNCNEPLGQAMFLHDRQFCYRLKYVTSGDKNDLEQVINDCDRAIEAIPDGSDKCKPDLNRIFKLNICQTVLGITPQLEIDRKVEPSPEGRMLVKVLLQQVRDDHFDGIESRREMLYSMCSARVNELDVNLGIARDYALSAAALSTNGAYFPLDKQNTSRFCDRFVQLPNPVLVL